MSQIKQNQPEIIDRPKSKDYFWRYWFLVPIYPYSQKKTIRKEVVPNTIWTFEQLQGIFYVVVPIRMSVVKLAQGGLLIYAPVAPTKECLRLLDELVAQHGEVKYIILPTASGLEHKVFVPPFARKFPQAEIYVNPTQWSFPVNLPLSWLGFPPQRTKFLPIDSRETPFASEFDYAILNNIDLNLGKFEEVAVLHKRSRTLLVTDLVASLPEQPPEIVQLDPYPLLFHARDRATDPMVDTEANRRKGWQRICLFALYFRSSVLDVPPWSKVFRDALRASDRSKKGYFGLFPFLWQSNWQDTFNALRGNGRLFVAPILQTLILNRAPQKTLTWANKVASWDFQQIVACHFKPLTQATPQQFRQAFSFLEKYSYPNYYPLPPEDFQTLQEIDRNLCKFKLVPPPQEKI